MHTEILYRAQTITYKNKKHSGAKPGHNAFMFLPELWVTATHHQASHLVQVLPPTEIAYKMHLQHF